MPVVNYLSTLDFDQDWLDSVAAVSPDVVVRQVTTDSLDAVPAGVLAGVDVLHTSAALPERSRMPRLRWVQLDTSGVDHVVGHPIWDDPDCEITTIGGVSPGPIAEFVQFAILGFAHRLPSLLAVRRTRDWPTNAGRWRDYGPAPVAGATVTVVGYGRIGREIGHRARALGLHVIGVSRSGVAADAARLEQWYDPLRRYEQGNGDEVELVAPDRLHEALSRADYVVIVVPLTGRTRGMVDAEAIKAMKPGAVLINVARGGIVDESALLDAVRSGAVGGAVLDVFDDEPLPPGSPWWDEPNVLVTPHVSGLAAAYRREVASIVKENLRRFLDGEVLLNRVDRAAGY
jgi:phosphoglycerate dehydrogenase-like enzyme